MARMLEKRIDGILTGFSDPISNGPVAGFNSRIQAIKSPARGFRIFEHYRMRMLFLSGKPKPETQRK
jgi:transposase